jgi:plastocyanin
MKKSLLLIVCVIAGAIAIGTPLLRAVLADKGADIKIDNFSFTPSTITVAAGTQVHWTNGDDIPHTVVSEDKSFKSKALDTNDQFSYTFTKPGTYNYFCSIHPKMTATVVVK